MTAAAVPVLREVRLYGRLGQQFGRVFRLAVATPAEAARALCAVLPGFRRAFVGDDGQARYHVFVGRGERRRDVGEAEAGDLVGGDAPIRFVPVIAGAKRGGLLQTVIGVVLIVAGAYFNMPQLVNAGISLVVGGVIQMLSPQRRKQERTENQPSYAFDGPVNINEQGGPVPLAFGLVLCGSTVVSQGLSARQLIEPAAYGPGQAAPPPTPSVPPWRPQWG